MYHRLNCEICGFNTYTDNINNIQLVEYKRSSVQGGVPKMDQDGKVTQPKMIALPKKYKCPKCGRLLSARKIKEAEVETKNNNEQNISKRGPGGFERYQF